MNACPRPGRHARIALVLLVLPTAGCVVDYGPPGPFPNLNQAEGNLQAAIGSLRAAPPIFGGHKAEAVRLIEAAINGMLTSLDPHSGFVAATDYEDLQTQTRGTFGGLGIEVGQEDGLVKVISPMDDTPAAKAGIKPGDFISHVNGESLMGLSLDEAVDKMRGPIGSEVTVTILRKGE